MSTVQIYVLQTPQILLDGEQVILPYKKAEALLFYMAIEKKATRDQIAALLWDSCDEATAKKNLRHALYTIRKIFHTDLVSSPTRQTVRHREETVPLRSIPLPLLPPQRRLPSYGFSYLFLRFLL